MSNFNVTHYESVSGVIILYDVCRRETFESIENRILGIKSFGNSDISIFIVGNKDDLYEHREVSSEKAQELVNRHDLLYTEISSKNHRDIELVVLALCSDIYRKILKKTHNHI